MKSFQCLIAALSLVLTLLPTHAESSQPAPNNYVIFCSPGLSKEQKKLVALEFQKIIAGGSGKGNDPQSGMKPGDTLQVFNASNLALLGELRMPESARTANLQFKAGADLVKGFFDFLKIDNATDIPAKIPSLVSSFKEKVRAKDAKVLIIGTPLYFDDVTAHDMRKGWLSDGYFQQQEDVTVFSTLNKEKNLRGCTFRFCTLLGDENYGTKNKGSHKDKVKRFWALYFNQCGGKLVSFQSDIPTGFQTLLKDDLEEFTYSVNKNDKRMMLVTSETELSPGDTTKIPVGEGINITQVDGINNVSTSTNQTISMSGDDLSWITADPQNYNKTHSNGDVGQTQTATRVALTWPTGGENADQDLDLYVRSKNSTEELCYKLNQSKDGKYTKDFPANSKAKFGFEIVDLNSNVEPANLQIWVNAYSGKPKVEFTGEVRVLHRGKLTVYPVKINAKSGNQGADSNNRNRSKYWIDVFVEK